MTLTWQHPQLLWLQIIFPVLVVLWLYVENRRRSRIRLLGNPFILGLSLSPVSRATATLLFALSASAVAGVIALPEPKQDQGLRTGPEMAVLLDAELRESGHFDPEISIDAVNRYIREIAQARPGVKVSLYRASAYPPSTGPEMLIPPTGDLEGLLILLDRIRFGWIPMKQTKLIGHAQDLLATHAETSDHLQVLILTPRSAGEVAAEFPFLEPAAPDPGRIVVVHVAPYSSISSDPSRHGGEGLTFIGGASVGSVKEFLSSSNSRVLPATRAPLGWTYVQILAGIGLLLLQVELVLRDASLAR